MKTCLIVDDSSVIRKVARRILEGLDFQIVEAEDGEKAMEVCKRGMPDAILLDWNMPVMDGLTFVKEVRTTNKDIPIVMITTESERSRVIVAIEAGVSDYLVKPFTADDLSAKLRKWIPLKV